ncbi:MAG TPA: GAF domain-containing protein [Gaiellaceae bacterium]|nr:GAF domain-containing protein [Gaiellaceae bacterium]
MTHHDRVILLEVVPLLVLAALYLGVALALTPELVRRRRRFSWLGLGIWLVFVLVGALAAVAGGASLGDDEFIGGFSPWPVFALTMLAYVPAVIFIWRWGERHLLVSAAPRVDEAEQEASERRRGAEAVSRLSSALTRGGSGAEAANRLFDELESVFGLRTALIATVEAEAGRACGLAARGVDEAWWRTVELDLDYPRSAIVSVARKGEPLVVLDVDSSPNVNQELARRVGARSAAFVPLVSEGSVTAVLVVASAEPRTFTPSETALMQDLANETALALGQASSQEAFEAALERERLVADISRRVRSELDLDAVLSVAVSAVGEALGLSRAFIRLGEAGADLPLKAEWHLPELGPIGEAARRLPVSNLAARGRRTVAVGDVVTSPDLEGETLGGREALLEIGSRSALATPILVFERMIGVFGLHRSEASSWSAHEIAVAEAVAREIGLAVHTARLLQENERRLQEQAALLKAGQVLTSDLRFAAVIQRLVTEVVQLLEADAADCWIFDKRRTVLRCEAVLGVPERNIGREITPQGTFERVLTTGRPFLKRDFSHAENPAPTEDYRVFAEVMDAPITWLGEVRGILGVCARDHDRFAESDLELLDTFARLASLALHNAESFEERERQTQVQRGFYRIAEVLGSTLSLPQTLDALAQAACDALGGSSALALESVRGRLVLAGSHELPRDLEQALEPGIPEDDSPIAAAADEGRILSSSSLSGDDRFGKDVRGLLARHGYGSLLSAPVLGAQGQKHAVVVLFREEREFSDEDLALARHLTGAARGALERAELFEGERRAHTFSQRLADLGGLLATKLDPAAAFAEVVQEAPALLEADAAVLRLLEDDELVVRAAWGPGTKRMLQERSSSAAGPAGIAAQSRAPLALADARETPRFAHEDPLLANGMVACIAVPMLLHGGGLNGVLAVYDANVRTWRDDEVQALAALAATASAVFSSAELYERVAEEKERSEAILANIADGIVAVDREGDIVLWNATAEQISGVPAAEALGRRVADVLQRDLAGGGEGRERAVSIQVGDKEVWLSVSEAVMLDADGGVGGRIFAFRDVSSERAVEQMKSDFVATVSHELRTPLTSIYGFAETLMRGDVEFSDSERATFLGYIASESERLINIVDDLLSVARLETGTLQLHLEETEVGAVAAEVVDRVQEHAGRREFELDVENGGILVEADREKLSQVLLGLVDNAVKFSPEGGRVVISARRRAESAEVRVSDQGIGIPHGDRQRIFSKFYRADSAATALQGTGLGLFLARGLLLAMGGRIWVESKEGQGSTFVFELPLASAGSVEATPEEATV